MYRASGWGAFKQYFLGKEMRWGKPARGEFKIPKPVHSISAFQNGRFALPRRTTTRERLHVPAGYKRCAYFSVPLYQSSRNYIGFS